MHWDAEGQRVVVGVPQQDGDDLHPRRSGLPLPVPERALHGPLAVHRILPHLAPGRTEVGQEWAWYLGNEISGGSPWVCVALQVLFKVPQEMLLGKEESDAQGQQLPALREMKDNPFYDKSSGVEIKPHTCGLPYLCQGVVVRHPLVGLLDELTVHLILELRVRQAHLQGILGQ